MILGSLTLPWWGYVLVVTGLTQMTIISVTLYLHRHQAHRALTLHPIASHFFRFWLWLTTGIITKEWTAIHRKHHAKVESQEDPHSPVAKGIKKVFFEGAELYRREAKNHETLSRYGEGTPNDWLEHHVYTKHSSLGIGLMLVLNLLLFGALGLTIWAIQMAWIPLFAAGVINGIGHHWGYRNFECKDASRNILPIGFFIGGEELHNNHHAYATSAKFSIKWWEVDIGWLVIRALQFVGLAKPKRVAPVARMISTKTSIDGDTLRAIIHYRLQVMARYTREVIIPLWREEKKQACKAKQALLKAKKKVLIRDVSIMLPAQKHRLATILDNFHSLKVAYQFRIKLQDIWSRSAASQKELIEALKEWCQQAEASGMETLLNFARGLKTYVPLES